MHGNVLKTRDVFLEKIRILSRDMLSVEDFSYFDLLIWITNSTHLKDELYLDLRLSPSPMETDRKFKSISRRKALLQIWIAMKFSQIMDNNQIGLNFFPQLIQSEGSATLDDDFSDFEYVNIDLTDDAMEDIPM